MIFQESPAEQFKSCLHDWFTNGGSGGNSDLGLYGDEVVAKCITALSEVGIASTCRFIGCLSAPAFGRHAAKGDDCHGASL